MNAKSIVYVGLSALAAIVVSCSSGPKDGEYSIQLLTTNDVHGTYFDSTYVGGNVRNSLYSVKYVIDSVRNAAGLENVVLIDAGDILQGDNAAYYFNYVDTLSPHVYPRLAKYMGYDAAVVGNHDIETGHDVYDRVAEELKALGIPFLAGNAVRNDNGKPYFPLYTMVEKQGVRVAVLGFTNANMKNWLSETLWSGMTFEDLTEVVQKDVDMVIAKEKPHVVVVAVHSGTGNGDGKSLESQGLDLFKSLKGVDFVVCSHDHRPTVVQSDSICLINSGSHCRYVGHGTVSLSILNGKVASKSLKADLLKVDRFKADTAMAGMFRDDFKAVKDFSTAEIGELEMELRTVDAYSGMSHYLNLVHTLGLSSGADISMAAPLTYNKTVQPGTILYNDLFTIYPFENQLYLLRMTGKEIKAYLEASYDGWINTISSPAEHLLKISNNDDPRTGQKSWSFVSRSYNFDSAGGLNYTVDVTKPAGERITISSLADGRAFDDGSEYSVAMTSYRASGGGGLLKAAGVDTDRIDERVIEYCPEFRVILYDYIKANGGIFADRIGDGSVIGGWSFVPEKVAAPAMERDLKLLFPRQF